tara:strand:+ start:980 stop:1543 length:564 start_codon:yes stop_codon:yes gene_type:complete
MKLLIVDNYDSFTFNLKHLCEPYVSVVNVVRNNHISMDLVHGYDKIIISPGPGLPQDAGQSLDLIKNFHTTKDILGICLGAQALATFFNYDLFNLNNVMHGKKSSIQIIDNKSSIYNNIPDHIGVGRYHSWAININKNSDFCISSVDDNGVVMSFNHLKYKLTGIQYHPESIMTEYGPQILKNWILS